MNLELSLNKEFLVTDGAGGYCASSLGGCNTRKYHGLLVVPQPQIGKGNFVLLSSLDELVTYNGNSFQLGVHRYPGTYHPEGYKHISKFGRHPVPHWRYEAGGAVLSKELMMDAGCIMLRYTLLEGDQDVQLKLHPFLAFRNVHTLCKANLLVNKKISTAINGIQLKIYAEYTDLYMQLSQPCEFVQAPDWYYNIEYTQEQLRGYESMEDLYVPGYFSTVLKKGEQVVFCAGAAETNVKNMKPRFANLLKKKTIPGSLKECLEQAAAQFLVADGKEAEVKAGYYWFDRWGRDTFIALPGLTLTCGNTKLFKAVVNSMLPQLKNGLFPNAGYGVHASYNTVDASLWFVWALQQYTVYDTKKGNIWKEYGAAIKSVLENYRQGTGSDQIKMDTDCLITAGPALTWMDAVAQKGPVTPRAGKQVEINALWYNAICFALDQAKLCKDEEFLNNWAMYPGKIKESFMSLFWSEEKGYLADYVGNGHTSWSVRPNQVFALSVPHSPVPVHMWKRVLGTVAMHLLTPRGLRTLSPYDPEYCGTYGGNQEERDSAYHQGTVWPWLTGHFAEAYLKAHGEEGVAFVNELYEGFIPAVDELCLDTLPEVYDGNFPHKPGGAVAQAWSVAEILRTGQAKNHFKKHSAAILEEVEK